MSDDGKKRAPTAPAQATWLPARILWVLLGATALLLALIGVVLPVLPTTPFVILAAFAFGKGYPAWAARLENHPVFGPMIANWRAHGAIAPRYKTMAITMMGAAFLLSVFLEVPGRVLLIQGACLMGAGLFILTRPNGPDCNDQTAITDRKS